MISQRTRAALQAARDRGVQLGGRRGAHRIEHFGEVGRAKSREVRAAKAGRRAEEVWRLVASLRAEGVTTFVGIAHELNTRSIPAPRGGRWSAGQVRRVVQRSSGVQV